MAALALSMAYACTQPNALVGRELEKGKAAQPLAAQTKPANAQTPPQAATDMVCPPIYFTNDIEVCKPTQTATVGVVGIGTFGSCVSYNAYYVEFHSQATATPAPDNAALPGKVFSSIPYGTPFYSLSYINTNHQTLYYSRTYNLTNIPPTHGHIWVRVYQLPFNVGSSSYTGWKKALIFSGNAC